MDATIVCHIIWNIDTSKSNHSLSIDILSAFSSKFQNLFWTFGVSFSSFYSLYMWYKWVVGGFWYNFLIWIRETKAQELRVFIYQKNVSKAQQPQLPWTKTWLKYRTINGPFLMPALSFKFLGAEKVPCLLLTYICFFLNGAGGGLTDHTNHKWKNNLARAPKQFMTLQMLAKFTNCNMNILQHLMREQVFFSSHISFNKQTRTAIHYHTDERAI